MLPIGGPMGIEEVRKRQDWRAWRPTLIASGLSMVVVAALIAAFESVSAYERPVALASLTSSIYWLAAALVGSCGTIAALMLTILSVMEQLETRRMGPHFLFHMRLTVIGAFATITLAVAALLLTVFPSAGGSDVSPPRWQVDAVFFALLALTALMVGGFALVLSSLYATIADVFRNLPEAWVEDILADDEDPDRLEGSDGEHRDHPHPSAPGGGDQFRHPAPGMAARHPVGEVDAPPR